MTSSNDRGIKRLRLRSPGTRLTLLVARIPLGCPGTEVIGSKVRISWLITTLHPIDISIGHKCHKPCPSIDPNFLEHPSRFIYREGPVAAIQGARFPKTDLKDQNATPNAGEK